jgi:DtxR family Mn-dependent transcriptional regulator
MAEQPTVAVQDYLKTLHRLGGADKLVSPVDIADRLGVRSPSVTGMLKRLAEAGWIEYEVGKGAKLSPAGLREARRVVRRHRLVELFLHRVLGLDWSEVDVEAEALEHAVSPRLEQAIATEEGVIAPRHLQPLSSFPPGACVVVREVPDDDPQRLKRWRELGLTPGATARLISHQPLDDVFELEVNGTIIRLGSEGLEGVLGEARG